MSEIPTDADAFPARSPVGRLTTIRSSGGPQVSMVAYDWDGTDLVISCRSTAAKYVNASRRPDVAFTVSEGVDCATVVGRAVVHGTGPERNARTGRVRSRLRPDAPWAAEILDQQVDAGLDDVGRVTITVVPDDVGVDGGGPGAPTGSEGGQVVHVVRPGQVDHHVVHRTGLVGGDHRHFHRPFGGGF